MINVLEVRGLCFLQRYPEWNFSLRRVQAAPFQHIQFYTDQLCRRMQAMVKRRIWYRRSRKRREIVRHRDCYGKLTQHLLHELLARLILPKVGTWSLDQTLLWTPGTNATTGEHVDLSNLALVGAQLKLVQAVKAAGKSTIVVFVSGKPVAEPWIQASM
jgi:Glycosyl hydrolase family 3 C-terminal domain